MRTAVNLSFTCVFALACAPVDPGHHSRLESGWDEPTDETHAPMQRAVSNPGFAFIDVDGDRRYDTSVDTPAVLDASGSLSTPHSVVVPHERGEVLLWSDEAVTLDIGGDLYLYGTIGCDNPCTGGSGSSDCIIDISVAGDLDAKSKGAVYANAQTGSAELNIWVGGDLELRSVELEATHGTGSTAAATVDLQAEGEVDALGADVILTGTGDRSLSISAGGDKLSLGRMDVDADDVLLHTCLSTTAGCAGVPIVDLRRFQLQSSAASLCLDGDDVSNASGTAVRTSRRTASNTCL